MDESSLGLQMTAVDRLRTKLRAVSYPACDTFNIEGTNLFLTLMFHRHVTFA